MCVRNWNWNLNVGPYSLILLANGQGFANYWITNTKKPISFVFFLYTLLKLTKESIVTLNNFCVNYFDKHGENVKNIFTLNLQYKYICSNLKTILELSFDSIKEACDYNKALSFLESLHCCSQFSCRFPAMELSSTLTECLVSDRLYLWPGMASRRPCRSGLKFRWVGYRLYHHLACSE